MRQKLSSNAIERTFSHFLADFGRSCQNLEKKTAQTPFLEALIRCPIGSAVLFVLFLFFGFSIGFGRAHGVCMFFSPHLCVGFLFLILYPTPRPPPLPSPPPPCHTQLCHTPLCHAPFFTRNFVTHNSVTHLFVTHHLSHTTLSHTIFHTQLCPSLCFTHNIVTHTQLCHTLSFTQLCHTHTQLCHTQVAHTQLCHTPSFTHNFVTHNFLTHNFVTRNMLTHTTLAHTHTTLSHTHNFVTHNIVTHNLLTHLTHKFVTHTQLRHTHSQIGHTHTHAQPCHTPSTCVPLGRRGWVWWRAWSGRRGLVARLVAVSRPGRRGTLRGRRGNCSHPPSFCVARVALGDICPRLAWQAWHLWHWAGSRGALGCRSSPGAPRHFAGQGWHLVTSTFPCVAGVALADIYLRSAWHLRRHLLYLSLFVWRGMRGTSGAGLGLAARFGTWRHRRSICVAGVALGRIHLGFAWQAWHLWHWAQHFHTWLCQTENSFTSHSFTHTHNSFICTTLAHRTLSQTPPLSFLPPSSCFNFCF